jgi:hypothetical protein
MNLSDADREALERSLTVARSESAARSKQLDAMLRDEPWAQVARFASYASQTRLKMPDDARHVPGAARLLKRLLDAELSRYEPDPLRALRAEL